MNDQPQRASPAQAPVRGRRAFRLIRVTLLVAALGGLALWAGDWIRTALLYIHETDARVAADMVTVSSRVAGRIIARPVDEGARLSAGDVIARLDSREAEATLAEYLARREGAEAERARLDAEIAMVDAETKSGAEGAASRLRAAEALVAAITHEFTFSEAQYKRARSLNDRGVVPVNALDQARTDYLSTRQNLVRAKAQVANAEAALAEARAKRRRIEVLQRQRDRLDRRIAELAAVVERQLVTVDDHTVRSPLTGVVDRVFAEPGEYVEPGQRIALMHDPSLVWVEANVRETDIRKLVLGQAVEVRVDAYPDVPFAGRIIRIGAAATSAFALLPNPNPSGNFTKVTQRLPVRIAVAQKNGMLRPGMMVEVLIDVGDR